MCCLHRTIIFVTDSELYQSVNITLIFDLSQQIVNCSCPVCNDVIIDDDDDDDNDDNDDGVCC